MLNHYLKLLVNKLNFRRIKYTIEYIFPPKSPPSKKNPLVERKHKSVRISRIFENKTFEARSSMNYNLRQ